jgi:hypothetical protein
MQNFRRKILIKLCQKFAKRRKKLASQPDIPKKLKKHFEEHHRAGGKTYRRKKTHVYVSPNSVDNSAHNGKNKANYA